MYYTGASVSRMNNRAGKPWRGYLQYKDPVTGKWKKKSKVFKDCKRKSDARIALEQWRKEEEAKAAIEDRDVTVSKAIESYLETQFNLNQISRVTYQNSLRLARTVIFPIIGAVKFVDLTQKDVQECVNKISANYKPSSTKTIFSVLSKTCKAALKNNELLIDPTKNVTLPRDTDRSINYLDLDGRRKFLSLMSPASNFYLPSMIAFYTGMRAGEICALTWSDINLGIDTIRINKSAKDYRLDNGKHAVEVSKPKTAKSIRVIPIIEPLKEILMKEVKEKRPDDKDRVVSWSNPRLLCSSFLKWSKRNNLMGAAGKPITMHSLRHSFATVGVQSHMDIKSLSSILGHSSTAMTLDIYASDDEMAKRQAMDALSGFLTKENESDL